MGGLELANRTAGETWRWNLESELFIRIDMTFLPWKFTCDKLLAIKEGRKLTQQNFGEEFLCRQSLETKNQEENQKIQLRKQLVS